MKDAQSRVEYVAMDIHSCSAAPSTASNALQTCLLLVVCTQFLLPNFVLAQEKGDIGVGFFDGPTNGATVNFMLSQSNAFKLIAPLSFKNVVFDYQYFYWDIVGERFRSTLRFSFYFGVGIDVSLSDEDQKNDKNGRSKFSVSARLPLGLALRLLIIPVDIFMELAPNLTFFNGSNFDLDTSSIAAGNVGFGVRFYF